METQESTGFSDSAFIPDSTQADRFDTVCIVRCQVRMPVGNWSLTVSCPVDDITPLLPGDAVAWLRIADEARRFPFRPIAAGLFLIGRGSGCDLRLGGEVFPELHSVLQVEPDATYAIAIAPSPPLVVNGEAVRTAPLFDGDLLEIGDVRCVFRLQNVRADSAEPDVTPAAESTTDLLDGVESEMALIEALQSDGNDRLQRLLEAAQDAVEGLEFARTLKIADYSPLADRQTAGDPFGPKILERLQTHETRLDDILHVLEQVVRQQQLITAAIQCLADKLTGSTDGAAASSLRASA